MNFLDTMFSKITKLAKALIYGIIGHFIIKPLVTIASLFIKPKYITFIGRDNGLFLDNVKYTFLSFYDKKDYINNLGYDIIFLTEDINTYKLLKEHGLPVTIYPSLKSLIVLLRTKLVIVDNYMWIYKFKVFLLKHAIKIQLWHGAGLKYIELLNEKCDKVITKVIYKCYERFPVYDVVLSTSRFYTEKVSVSFRVKKIWEIGYPRNDIFFNKCIKNKNLILLGCDIEVIKKICSFKNLGAKIILYTPTFRDTGRDIFESLQINFEELNKFLEKYNMLLVIKLHPQDKSTNTHCEGYNRIIWYSRDKDIYPVLPLVDALIVDYSSIYTDFLILDRPIIFYVPDIDMYTQQDRQIQFDFYWITPGPKVYNQIELQSCLENILIQRKDNYKKQREEIRKIIFDHFDECVTEWLYKKILETFLD